MIIQGDCIEEMKKLPENSVDAIITDPPYGLGFMGKEWDKVWDKRKDTDYKRKGFGKSVLSASTYQAGFEAQDFHYSWAKECLRVLKSGGYLLSFGGTRTYHRMTCGIEDAGFEIRDCIMWLYGSGFPKSLNIGKQIDKIQGNEREVIGKMSDLNPRYATPRKGAEGYGNIISSETDPDLTKGTSEWEGWGTALKPACEPIVVARKPLSEKNVALNVLKWGTGGINIDACRIGTEEKITNHSRGSESAISKGIYGDSSKQETHQTQGQQLGRFPANIILDEEAGKMLDEQAPNKGASRFFYCAKASKSERNFGCEELPDGRKKVAVIQTKGVANDGEWEDGKQLSSVMKNNHPTVKPIKLMEYLIKLVSKEGAVILDPFLGSGTTAIACVKTNRKFIGIDKKEEYIKIAEARIKGWKDKIEKENKETQKIMPPIKHLCREPQLEKQTMNVNSRMYQIFYSRVQCLWVLDSLGAESNLYLWDGQIGNDCRKELCGKHTFSFLHHPIRLI